TTTGAGEDVGVRVVEILVIAEEVVDHELLLVDVRGGTGAAPAHLLVQDGAANAAAHNQVQYLPAIEAGVQHADAHYHHRQLVLLESTDGVVGIGDVGGDDF